MDQGIYTKLFVYSFIIICKLLLVLWCF